MDRFETQGSPYSREIITAWATTPPVSTTTPETIENTVVQPGSVATVTRMSPVPHLADLRQVTAHPGPTGHDAGARTDAHESTLAVDHVVVERLPAAEVLGRLLP